MKKAISLAIVLFIALTMCIGCSTTSKPAQTSNSSKTAGENTPDAPITFTMFCGEIQSQADNYESPVAKEIARRTGVTLKIEYLVSGDEKEKLSLMAASGDYPDLIYPKTNTAIIKDANGILKLDDLIEQYGPNIKAFYGNQIRRLVYDQADPHIYFVGGFTFNDESMVPINGFELQLDAIKELGYPKIKNLQDFENAIKTYYAKHPTYDGQPTIPLTLCADDWMFNVTVGNPALFAMGSSDDADWMVDQSTLKVERALIKPEAKEYFKWLNHMNNIGLLDPEAFLQKDDQYLAKIASGRVLALTDSTWHFDPSVKALRQANKGGKAYGWLPVTLNDSIKPAMFMSPGYLGGAGVCISAKCKEPVRAIKFIDWLCTEEAQILTHWGVEGDTYTVVDGQRVMKPETLEMYRSDPNFSKKTGIGLYGYPFPYYGNMQKSSNGQYFDPFNSIESVIAQQTPLDNEILSAYGVKAWKDMFPQSSEFPVKSYGAAWLVNVDDTDFNAIQDKIQQYERKAVPAMILGKPEEFEGKWNEFVKGCKDFGVDKITATMEQKIKERAAMWK